MTVSTIHIIENVSSRYGALTYFQKKLQEAFKRASIHSELYNLDEIGEEKLASLFKKDPPDYTLGFNVILSGYSFLEPLGIQHVAILVDPVWEFPELFVSPNVLPAFVEKDSTLLYSNQSLYLPHAVEPEALVNQAIEKREYDVVFPASFIDSEKERTDWVHVFNKTTVDILCALSEDVLSKPDISLLQAFNSIYPLIQAEIEAKRIPVLRLLSSLSTYVRGEDKRRLLSALHDFDVHIFCSKDDAARWKTLGRVIIHDELPFSELSSVYQRSKIVLHSAPHLKHGFHERLFMAMASGASVLSMSHPFYNEAFGINRSNIAINTYKEAPAKIQEILSNEELRLIDVQDARKVIAKSHTWDIRAQQLITQLKISRIGS